MRIIISPAKKMKFDTDSMPHKSEPQFLTHAKELQAVLKCMNAKQLQALWKCNDSIAALNVERLNRTDLTKQLTPAIFSYEGIQYQYLAPNVFEDGQYTYLNEHLRIISGFYGLLRPFDGVVAYRLEMQAKLKVGEHKDLYDYWGSKLAKQLASETDVIVNLASKEYSKAVTPHLPKGFRFITCTFGQLKGDGCVVEKATMCKMARGQMVRFLAEHYVTDISGIKSFDQFGYTYSKEHSSQHNFVFIKEKKTC